MVPLSKVQDLIKKHAKLEKELSSEEIDKNSFAEKSKEYSDLNEIIKEANSYYNYKKNKEELEKLINDEGIFILYYLWVLFLKVGMDLFGELGILILIKFTL